MINKKVMSMKIIYYNKQASYYNKEASYEHEIYYNKQASYKI